MFPPIEDTIFQSNPKFAALHKTLTTRILGPDGSTIHPASAEATSNAEVLFSLSNHPLDLPLTASFQVLKAHRITTTKSDILRTSLCSLPLDTTSSTSSTTAQLPPNLLELILLLSLRLSPSPQPPSTDELLQSTAIYASLPSQIPHISALLSTHLHTQAQVLARLLHPTSNASFLHRQIPKIVPAITSLKAENSAKKSHLAAAGARLVPLTIRILEAYRNAIELVIRILEQNKHGQLSRFTKAKAEVAALSAQELEFNAQSTLYQGLGSVYTAEVTDALRNYTEHLRVSRSRLREREREAGMELSRYGVGRDDNKEKVMKEVARVYGEMGKQIDEVKKDVERLQSS
jgi:hypothetical protein